MIPSFAPFTSHPVLACVALLAVVVPFAVVYMDQPLKLDFVWAGLCLVGAVYFIFRA